MPSNPIKTPQNSIGTLDDINLFHDLAIPYPGNPPWLYYGEE